MIYQLSCQAERKIQLEYFTQKGSSVNIILKLWAIDYSVMLKEWSIKTFSPKNDAEIIVLTKTIY